MTKRFFYSDPLTAAWMVRHHGMMLTTGRLSGDVIHVRCEQGAMVISHLAIFPLFKAYIHPDSLHLLEPQVGDWGRGPYAGEVIGVSENLVTIQVPERHNGKSHFCQPKSEFKIVSRDGFAFMCPEVEEV
jgi:hypothetical protein